MNTDELDRHAYNAAFYELQLRWCWDHETWSSLTSSSADAGYIRTYVLQQQPHLLKAYDIDFLVGVIEVVKQRWLDNMRANDRIPAIDWKALQCAEVGV